MRTRIAVAACIAAAGWTVTSTSATTREVAQLPEIELSSGQSVLSEATGGLFRDAYDELRGAPWNLPYANVGRHANLGPWPGQEGEYDRFLNALVGNNGATNVRGSADALKGSWIRRPGSGLTWGVSVAYLADERGDRTSIDTDRFGDDAELSGYDVRFAFGRRSSAKTSWGGGVTLKDRSDETTDRSFEQGVGGFFSTEDRSTSEALVDLGLRRFRGESSSWTARAAIGFGDTELRDLSETLDASGAISSRFVGTKYEVARLSATLEGGFDRRRSDDRGELRVRFGFERTEDDLDNTDLSFTEAGGSVTPTVTLTDQDAVADDTLFASAGTVRVYGTTQLFSGARLAMFATEGSTRVDAGGTIVDESIDDDGTRLDLTLGLRQPLWGDRLRLIAAAHGVWADDELTTSIDISTTAASDTRTTTRYTVGVEGVFSNITFDLAWLFGEDVSGFSSSNASRQVIELDRVVVSATLAW